MNRILRRVALWLVFVSLAVYAPAAARNATSPPFAPATPQRPPELQLAVTPSDVAKTVALGQTTSFDLTVSNDNDSPQTPILYEAWPASAATGAVRRAAPAGMQQVPLPEQAERIDPQIQRELTRARDGRTDFLVFLADQPDLQAAYGIAGWNDRGWFVYSRLREHAEQSQRELREWLDERGVAYRPLWVANALLVRGNSDDLQALAGRAEIAMLRANRTASLDPLPLAEADRDNFPDPACRDDGSGTCWNISQIEADRVWREFGVSGTGVTVASIDSGVAVEHPALVAQYRGYLGPDSFAHDYNWYDPQGILEVPGESNPSSHGTHTMGSIVGRSINVTGGTMPAVGVAPGAHWISARGCAGLVCAESDLMLAAQWLLAPTDAAGANARPDLRPHIINNSWAAGEGGDETYAGYVAAWQAAGIFPVFAAGNDGSSTCSSINSPADYANAYGVGATDSSDRVASFSSVGPTLDGRLKPDLTAPGQSIVSTAAGDGAPYQILSGTSMAAPHVAGAVALLWSANPELIGNYQSTYDLLGQTALPLTDTRCGGDLQPGTIPNNIYGFGRLNVYQAVAAGKVEVPWLEVPAAVAPLAPGTVTTVPVTLDAGRVPGPGTYTARILIGNGDLTSTPASVTVTLTVPADTAHVPISGSLSDATSGLPVAGIISVSNGPEVATAVDGTFSLLLPPQPGPYEISAGARGYVKHTQLVTPTDGLATILAFALERDEARISLDASPQAASLAYGETMQLTTSVGNIGTRALNYTISVPDEQFGVWRSDELDGPAHRWIARPANASGLALQDDSSSSALPLGFSFPFYGQIYSEVYVSANGLLTFTPLEPWVQPYRVTCLPAPETTIGNTAAIVPLRMDLDPAKGGEVWYAQTSEGFVVTFADVPLHADTESRFTFQVVLQADGHIFYNYRTIARLPATASFGVQPSAFSAQSLGCGNTAPLQNDLTVELRPQPATGFWLSVNGPTSGELAPGAEHVITVTVNWVHPVSGPPYSGAVLFKTNDPTQTDVRIPVRLTTSPAPYEMWMPLSAYER